MNSEPTRWAIGLHTTLGAGENDLSLVLKIPAAAPGSIVSAWCHWRPDLRAELTVDELANLHGRRDTLARRYADDMGCTLGEVFDSWAMPGKTAVPPSPELERLSR